jgi:hypothetical protein
MKELKKKIGEMSYDGLVSDLNPPVEVRGRIIAHNSSEQKYPRGMIFSRSVKSGKLYPLGSQAEADDTLKPDCVLCEETIVGKADEVTAEVYTAGCFDLGKVTAGKDYEITEADKDELRKRNIVFKSAFESN